MKSKLLLSIAMLNGATSVQTQELEIRHISDIRIDCKPSTAFRAVGDFPIENSLQFGYKTQENWSCRVTLLEGPEDNNGAKVVFLPYHKRRTVDPLTNKDLLKTPIDYNIPGFFEFMYTTPNRRWGFIDYGNNTTLRNVLETIKSSQNEPNPDQQLKLQMKHPATIESLKTYGAKTYVK